LRLDSVELCLEFTSVSTSDTKKTQIKLGETNLNINDSLLRKFYESILKDMPEANVSKYRGLKPKKEEAPVISSSQTEFKWSGISIAISDKKDKMILKVLGLKFEKGSCPSNNSESLHVKLRDF
jgi:RNA polymerase subunit RPABC4/transcription elongation factor Spt4